MMSPKQLGCCIKCKFQWIAVISRSLNTYGTPSGAPGHIISDVTWGHWGFRVFQ